MQKYKQKHVMYFLMCFLMHVFGTITGEITTEYLTPRYYWLVTGVMQLFMMDRSKKEDMEQSTPNSVGTVSLGPGERMEECW